MYRKSHITCMSMIYKVVTELQTTAIFGDFVELNSMVPACYQMLVLNSIVEEAVVATANVHKAFRTIASILLCKKM